MVKSPFRNLNKQELKVFERLNTPVKVQNFLNSLKINFEKNGETNMSPRKVLKTGMAHCMEGAMLAAAILWYHGQEPLLLDLRSRKGDSDHVVTLFKKNGYWGAISKTNHAVLRYREPIYKTIRELALSYFHEYFLDNGQKTLREYSKPYNLKYLAKTDWLTTDEDLWDLAIDLDDSPHLPLLTKQQIKQLRKADPIEIAAGKILEYRKP